MPALIAICLLLVAAPALAHGADRHDSLGWTFDPWIVTPLITIAVLYAAGSIVLFRRRHGPEKKFLPATLFWCGLAVLVLALLSPLHELGEHLFVMHMIEHELVMAVAAPLLALAKPIGVIFWSMPRKVRRSLGRGLSGRVPRTIWYALTIPLVATLLHAIAIWGWHAPVLFDATVSNVLLHRLQHVSFFLTGLLFWWSVIWVSSRGAAAWHLFVTMMHTSVLGALLTFAPNVIFVAQTRYADQWGMTALEDQQLAGVIMWIPGGLIYAGAALLMVTLLIEGAGKGGSHEARFDIA